ncbi:MAG: hypothetical protein WBA16_05850, partial [Nonlabens sp.]
MKTKLLWIIPILLGMLSAQAQVTSFPYKEGFESGAAGWTASGTNSSWALGTPAGAVIDAPGVGANSWVTDLTGDYNNNELSFVTSPVFDFSSFGTDPTVAFLFNYITEGCCDEGWLESTIDAGATWVKVGAAGTGSNWYNDSSNEWWDGSSNGLVQSSNVLAGLAGQSAVQLRFVFSSDGSSVRDGFLFDEFTITAASAAAVSSVT